MSTNHQFSLIVDAPAELQASRATTPHADLLPVMPNLGTVLAGIGSLPREALFLGMALDGLPVLLNLHDPVPGPILVAGDSGSGKTALLKMMIRALQKTHRAVDVQFNVISNRLEEWMAIPSSDHQVGIFSAKDTAAQECILSLASWAHANRSRQAVLLLIDDLATVAKMENNVLQNLRWLLLRGSARKVWIITTLNAQRYEEAITWIPMFRTRLFGKISQEATALALGAEPASALDRLGGEAQFSLRENGTWLRFWVPSVEYGRG